MYIEPWLFWLLLAPVAAMMALYIGYLALLLVGLLSLTIGMGLSMACEGMSAVVHGLAAWYARVLGVVVRPFRHAAPWLDYAVVAGIALGLSLGTILWLAA